jgi:hypothetical protein
VAVLYTVAEANLGRSTLLKLLDLVAAGAVYERRFAFPGPDDEVAYF